VRAQLGEVFRIEHARVVAAVLRIVRDIDAAQEVVQEAFAQALAHWPADGIPDRPGAWLLTTARRRALDHLRHARRAGARVDALTRDALGAAHPAPDVPNVDEIPEGVPDDRLRLIFGQHAAPRGPRTAATPARLLPAPRTGTLRPGSSASRGPGAGRSPARTAGTPARSPSSRGRPPAAA
jgi:predicted RNA polymerase sigma factor